MKLSQVIDELLPRAFPKAKRFTNKHKSLVSLTVKLSQQAKKNGGDMYMTFREAAELYKPAHYKNGTLTERRGIIATVRDCALQITDISANMRGTHALTVVPATKKLLNEHLIIQELEEQGEYEVAVRMAETALLSHKGNAYVGLLVTTRPNGVVPTAYTNRNKRCADGKNDKNDYREAGWAQAGLLTEEVLAESLYEQKKELWTKELQALQELNAA